MSTIAVSIGYLRRRPLPCLGGCSTVILILGFWGLDLVSGLISSSILVSISVDSCCRYSLMTIDQKDIGLLGNLTVYISPLTIN